MRLKQQEDGGEHPWTRRTERERDRAAMNKRPNDASSSWRTTAIRRRVYPRLPKTTISQKEKRSRVTSMSY